MANLEAILKNTSSKPYIKRRALLTRSKLFIANDARPYDEDASKSKAAPIKSKFQKYKSINISSITSPHTGTHSGTNGPHTGTHSGTNGPHTGTHSGTNGPHTGTHSGTNGPHTGTHSGTHSGTKTDLALSGISLQIMLYLINNLDDKKQLITKKINLSSLAKSLGNLLDSTKKSLKRLKKRNIIKTVIFSNNRYDGYTIYKISFSFYKLFKKQKVCDFSSSYNNSIKETTTIEKKEEVIPNSNGLPDEWEKINFELLAPLGFSKNHLFDIYEANTNTPEAVQESLNHYAWGIEHNSEKYKKYKNHLTVLIGRLRKGKIWTESGYESPKTLALKQLIALREKEKKQQNEMIKQLVELEFPQWEKGLSEEEIRQIVPSNVSNKELSIGLLRTYFRQKVLIPKLEKQGKI